MREARARTADLKFDKLALDGATAAVKARKEDLVERLNAGRLAEIEAKEINAVAPKAIGKAKRRAA